MSQRAEKATFELASIIRVAHMNGALENFDRSEYKLQGLLRGVLPSYAQAEVFLSAEDRIDFLVRCSTLPAKIHVGIEVKIDGAPAEVMRQLDRYLRHERVDGIVLVTTKRAHRTLQGTITGKPVQVVWLRGGM